MPTPSVLAAVLDAPHDLAARRAFAGSDACEPERRRLVEVEDALAAKPSADLADERERLIARNGASWEPILAELAADRSSRGDALRSLAFELGFVSSVGAWGEHVLALAPLAKTSCYGLSLGLVEAKHFAALLESPVLGRLRELRLEFMHGFDPERLLELFRSPRLGPLTQLELVGVAITPEVAAAIGRITTLRSLELVAAPGSGSLAGTSPAALGGLTELRSLTLSGQDIDPKQLGKLLDAPFCAKLERFGLLRHKLGARGCKLLGGAGFDSLVELDLSDSNVGAHAVEFVASPKLARLARLRLNAAKLGAKQLPAVLDALDLPGLRTLELGALRFKEAGAEALAASDALARCGVVNLAIGGNAIGDDGAEALAGAEGLAKIRRLRINHNGIRADGVAALTDSPLLTGLEVLDIQSNKIQTKGATLLAGSAAAATLREIDIDHNWIGSKGAAALFGSKGLRALEVARFGHDNNFEDAGFDTLASSDIRLRTLIAGGQGSTESLGRFLRSPAVERLGWLQSFSNPADDDAAALASGELAPNLHTFSTNTMFVAPERIAALERRFAFSSQRGNRTIAEL